jgi:hypothetical protein
MIARNRKLLSRPQHHTRPIWPGEYVPTGLRVAPQGWVYPNCHPAVRELVPVISSIATRRPGFTHVPKASCRTSRPCTSTGGSCRSTGRDGRRRPGGSSSGRDSSPGSSRSARMSMPCAPGRLPSQCNSFPTLNPHTLASGSAHGSDPDLRA